MNRQFFDLCNNDLINMSVIDLFICSLCSYDVWITLRILYKLKSKIFTN